VNGLDIPPARGASWIENMVVAPFAPGVTCAGENVPVAPGGRPVADIVTTLLNAPPKGGTWTGTLTDPPCPTSYGVCAAIT
jgi:hypothetical protein